jgi:two-component system CheB/CheR fusion protein
VTTIDTHDKGVGMSATNRHTVLSYGIAVAGVVLAGLSHWWWDPLIGGTPPMRLLLVVVVTASAWLGGIGPSLCATVLGLIAIVVMDDAPEDPASLITRLVRFGSLALLITVLFEALHASRRRAETKEQQYRHSESRYRRLVETTAEGLWAIDGAGWTTYANPRMGEMLGVPPAQLNGRHLKDFLADGGDVPGSCSEAPNGPPAWHEVRLRRDDGTVRYALVTTRPIGPDEVPGDDLRSPGAAPGGQLLMVTDVTPLKQAEAALRAERDFSSAVLETAPCLIVVLDREGRVVRFNAACRLVSGYAAEEVIGRLFWELFLNPDETGSVRKGFERLLVGDGPLRFESQWRTKAGDRRLIAWSNSTLADPQGRIDFVIGTGTDITSLRRAEESLREKESMIHGFYDSSAMAMGIIELTEDDTRFISANAITDRFFGLNPGELEGKSAKELGAPLDRLAIWIEGFRACRATGRPVRFEYQSVWPTSPKWVAATLAAIDLPGSDRALCSFIVEDIADRKRTEEELLESKELSEAASRAKDRFLAVLSHELRTPLTPVLIAVSSMLESNPDPALLSALEMIRRNVELEARLIDDLLDVSRIVGGRLRLDLEVVDIHQAIRRAGEICRDETLAAGLDVVMDFRAPHHYVLADRARVMQVAWNLIRNAAKFTPRDGRLTIRTTNPPGPSTPSAAPNEATLPRLDVEFEDTGIGLDPGMLPRIFDPFEQGQDDLRGRSGGLGLGLAISRSLAESLGGRLTASSPGRSLGSTFRLELPTTLAPAHAPAERARTASPVAPGAAPRASARRILLVEDNPDTLQFLALVLRRRGHEVVTADRLATAFAAVNEAEGPFDLLLSDIELPDGTGLDLMRELNAGGVVAGIAMSGFGAEEDLRFSREAGFFDHLTKPIDLDRLDAAIRAAVSRVACQAGAPDEPNEPFRSST